MTRGHAFLFDFQNVLLCLMWGFASWQMVINGVGMKSLGPGLIGLRKVSVAAGDFWSHSDFHNYQKVRIEKKALTAVCCSTLKMALERQVKAVFSKFFKSKGSWAAAVFALKQRSSLESWINTLPQDRYVRPPPAEGDIRLSSLPECPFLTYTGIRFYKKNK